MIDKSVLGVAGEFAVATELCRRNIYAQLTLGNQKRTDLLVMDCGGKLRCVEVKAKQGREWPGCRGVPKGDSFLVFVDFGDRPDNARPDFYILTAEDWTNVVSAGVAEYRKKHSGKRVKIIDNCPVYCDEKKADVPYRGMAVRVNAIESYKDAWQKIGGVTKSVSEALD